VTDESVTIFVNVAARLRRSVGRSSAFAGLNGNRAA
jgi:hypothetical protein